MPYHYRSEDIMRGKTLSNLTLGTEGEEWEANRSLLWPIDHRLPRKKRENEVPLLNLSHCWLKPRSGNGLHCALRPLVHSMPRNLTTHFGGPSAPRKPHPSCRYHGLHYHYATGYTCNPLSFHVDCLTSTASA